MSDFLRGLDTFLLAAWQEPDVCAGAAAEGDDEGCDDGDDETNEDDEPGDGCPLPAAIAH